MIASGGVDSNIKIYDHRNSKIMRIFEDLHSGKRKKYKIVITKIDNTLDSICCVRWSRSGDLLASASYDKTAKLLDFKTGKVIYTGDSPNDSKWPNIMFLRFFSRMRQFSMFSLTIDMESRTRLGTTNHS